MEETNTHAVKRDSHLEDFQLGVLCRTVFEEFPATQQSRFSYPRIHSLAAAVNVCRIQARLLIK